MWDIYSIGDGQFLANILNSVAMIVGTGDFATLVRIGFGLGVLLIAFRGVMDAGRSVAWQQFVVALVVYVAFFGVTQRVSIEDMYNGKVYTVDNVPLGIAATGSIFSRSGYSTTRLFETGFSSPDMTETSFGMGLKRLQTAREATLNRIRIGTANSPDPQSDVMASWRNYIEECTLAAVDLNSQSPNVGKTLTEVLNGKLPDVLEFNGAGNYYTEIYTSSGPETLTCEQAYTKLNQYTSQRFMPVLEKGISSYYSENAMNGGASAAITKTALRDALDSVGEYGQSVDDYLKAVFLLPIYNDAVVGKHLSVKQDVMAQIVNEAVQKRNVQWLAQKSVFETVVQPMITFVEAFFYALTPIMGILVGLGVVGFKMLGKYIVLPLWIQLWMPMLAIVNAYIHYTTSAQMLASQNITPNALSIAGLQQWDGIIQSQLAVGGFLASSVPMIALFIVSGSYYALTNIAGSITGKDTIDEGKASPSTPQPVQFGSMNKWDAERGMYGSEAPGLVTGFSWSTADAAQTQSAAGEMQTQNQAFSSMLGQRVTSSMGSSTRGSESISSGISSTVGNSTSEQMLKSQGQSLSDKWASSSGITQNQIATLGASAAAGAGKGALMASMSESTSLSNDQKSQLANDLLSTYKEDSSWRGDYMKQVSSEVANGVDNIYTRGTELANDSQLQEQASESYQASQRYEQVTSSGVTSGTNMQIDGIKAGKQLAGDRQQYANLENALTQSGDIGAVDKWMSSPYGDQMTQRMGGGESGEDAARGYAMLITANGQNRYGQPSGENQGMLKDAANSALAGSFGEIGNPGAASGADDNAGTAGDMPRQPGVVTDGVQSGMRGTSVPAAAAVAGASAAGMASATAGATRQGQPSMRSEYEGSVATARSGADTASAPLKDEIQEANDRAVSESGDKTFSERAKTESGNRFGRFMGNIGDIAVAGYDSATSDRSFGESFQAQKDKNFNENFDFAKSYGISDDEANYYAQVKAMSGIDDSLYSDLGLGKSGVEVADERFGANIPQDRKDALYTAANESEGNGGPEYILSNLNRQTEDDAPFADFRSNSSVRPEK